VGLGPALRADQLHVLADVVASAADLALGCGAFGRGGDLARRPRLRDLHLDVGRAVVAQAIRGIEAAAAHVVMAVAAAVEMGLAGGDRLGEGRIARAVPAGLGHRGEHAAGIAEDAAEHARALLQPAGRLGAAVGLEVGAPAVAAALAIKLELEAGIDACRVAQVPDITRKLHFGHGWIAC